MNKAFTEVSAGLKDATAHAKGDKSGVIEHTTETLNVKAIREKTGMSQHTILHNLWYLFRHFAPLGTMVSEIPEARQEFY